MKQKWIARWRTRNGTSQELVFFSEPSLMLARLDFQLKLIDMKFPVPNEFVVEVGTLASSSVPRMTTLREPVTEDMPSLEGM